MTKMEVVVLGVLAERPMHAYEVLERARERGMALWVELSRASVYQVVKRLERDRLVMGRPQEGREGPDRRVYRITKDGRARLAAGVAELASAPEPARSDAAAALGLAHVIPAAAARAAADARERAVREVLQRLRAEQERTASAGDTGRAVSTAMLLHQEALAEAELAWLATYRASLAGLSRS